MENSTSDGQVSVGAGDVYDAFFVPALFAEWAPRLVEAAGASPGQSALDVACGTGVVTRHLAQVLGAEKVAGLDRNQAMLAVAQRRAPDIRWIEGRAEALPAEDGSFDAVTCQFGLMFFDDRVRALEEMRRVRRPGGRIALAVWASLDATPGYAAMAILLERLFGAEIADEIRAPYSLGEPAALGRVLDQGGLSEAHVQTRMGQATFPSLDDWLHTDIRGWTLAERIDEDMFHRLRTEAQTELASFVGEDGRVRFASPALIATG